MHTSTPKAIAGLVSAVIQRPPPSQTVDGGTNSRTEEKSLAFTTSSAV